MTIRERDETDVVDNHGGVNGFARSTDPRRCEVHTELKPGSQTALYTHAFKRSWKVILACLQVGILLGWLAASLATPHYQASSQVFIAFQSTDNSPVSMLQGASFSQQQVISYADIVTSPLVLQPVIDDMGLDETPDELAKRVEATTRRDTVLIDIAVTDTDPGRAAGTANAIAASLGEVIPRVERPGTSTPSPVHVTTVRPAMAPTTPSSPNSLFILAVGAAVGLSVGLGYSIFSLRRTTTREP